MRIGRAGKWIGLAAALLAGVIGAVAQPTKPERRCVGACDVGPANENVLIVSSGNVWLGVTLADVTAEKMAELKLKEEYGAIVTEVEQDSPAAKAGVRENDVILEYQGERVHSAAQLGRLVRETPSGRSVRLLISRAGQQQTLTATLEPREYSRLDVRIPRIRIPEFDIHIFTSRPRLGISADSLTPQLAEYFGVKQGKGVLVREVNAGSVAEKAGLKAGDVIVRVEDETIEDLGDLRDALAKKKGGETVTLGIVRNRTETSLHVQLEEARRRPRAGTGYDYDYDNDPEEIGKEYRESMRELQREMRELQRHLQKELGEKGRELQKDLIRLRRELSPLTVI